MRRPTHGMVQSPDAKPSPCIHPPCHESPQVPPGVSSDADRSAVFSFCPQRYTFDSKPFASGDEIDNTLAWGVIDRSRYAVRRVWSVETDVLDEVFDHI